MPKDPSDNLNIPEISDLVIECEPPEFRWECVVPPGLDLHAFTVEQLELWRKQSEFLRFYSRTKTKTTACRESGVAWYELMQWERENGLEFKERMDIAARVYTDRLEDHLTEMLTSMKPTQSATPLLNKLSAELPFKYGSATASDDASKEVLEVLKSLAGSRRDGGLGSPQPGRERTRS